MLLWLNAHTASEVSLEDIFPLLRKETESSRQQTRSAAESVEFIVTVLSDVEPRPP